MRICLQAILCTVILLTTFSCAHSKMMTYNSYQRVDIGDNIFDVQSYNGPPYEIRNVGNGVREYVYVERIPTAEGTDLFREYTLIVIDGRVTEKKMHESMPSTIQMQLQSQLQGN